MSEKTMNRKMIPVFALWKKTAKDGKTTYFSGKTETGTFLTAFFNGQKKNPKEPDVRVYTQDKDHNLSKEEYVSLWVNVAKSGRKYLTGKIGDKRVVGFINDKSEGNHPYVSVYYSEDDAAGKTPEQPKYEEVPFSL